MNTLDQARAAIGLEDDHFVTHPDEIETWFGGNDIDEATAQWALETTRNLDTLVQIIEVMARSGGRRVKDGFLPQLVACWKRLYSEPEPRHRAGATLIFDAVGQRAKTHLVEAIFRAPDPRAFQRTIESFAWDLTRSQTEGVRAEIGAFVASAYERGTPTHEERGYVALLDSQLAASLWRGLLDVDLRRAEDFLSLAKGIPSESGVTTEQAMFNVLFASDPSTPSAVAGLRLLFRYCASVDLKDFLEKQERAVVQRLKTTIDAHPIEAIDDMKDYVEQALEERAPS